MRRGLVGAALALLALPLILLASTATAATAVPPSVSVSNAWVVEPPAGTDATALFTVTLSSPAVGGESVHWATIAGSAGPSDYVAASGTVTFAPDETTQTIPVVITGDDRPEPNETFTLALTSVTGATLADASGLGTIASDEGPRTVSVGDTSVLEGKAGTTTNAFFTISVSPGVGDEALSVRYATADGTAVAGTDYTAKSGTLTFAAGDPSSKTVPVVVKGDGAREAAERFVLRLSAPVGGVLADASGTATVRNDDGSLSPVPAPGLSVGNAWVVEGDPGATTTAVFPVSLPAAATLAVTARWTTTFGSGAGSAGAADVTGGSGTLSIPVGQRATSVAVPVTGDDLFEGNETFGLTLSAPVNAVLADASATGTIADDEGPRTITVADTSLTEGDSGQTSALFVVTPDPAPVSGQAVSVGYATSNGTAAAGSDYVATSGRLTIPAGQTTGTIAVPVRGDTTDEPDQTFFLTLSAPTSAVLADAKATGTILDDDGPAATGPGAIATTGGSVTESPGAVASVPVSFARPAAGPLALTWSTGGGTATPGVDYTAQAAVAVTLPSGATGTTLEVPILDDGEAEPTETFFVTVTGPTGVPVGPPAEVAILDDETPGSTSTVKVAASGDIACAPSDPNFHNGTGDAVGCQQMATSTVAMGMAPDAVLALGDLQYEKGELTNFDASYAPSWGRMRDITHPAPGNHEYLTADAAGYYNYFRVDHTPGGTDPETGGTVDAYYAFDLGAWRVIALNSNCSSVGGCGPGSPEETWLRAELAAHPGQCTLAYWHHPRFSSGAHGDDPDVDGFWQALVAGGADLVLNGHDHDYERFGGMDAFGTGEATGVREIVAGLGGKNIRPFDPARVTRGLSQNTFDATFGVLGLTLRPGGYDWSMVPIGAGSAPVDSGSAACH